MSAAVPLPEPTLAEQALAAWDAEAQRRTALESDQERVDSLNARHLNQAQRAIQSRLGRAWLAALPAWKVARQIAEPTHHSVDLIADHEDEQGPWGLRYVSEITDGTPVHNWAGDIVNVLDSHAPRLVLIRTCPDDPDEWQEIGWDLTSVLELGGALRQRVPPCGDRHPLWADGPGDPPDPNRF